MSEFVAVFAGDTSLGDWYLTRASSEVRRRLNEEPMSFFDDLLPLVGDRDLFVANLETVLATDPDSPLEGQKNYLGWDDPGRTVSVLKTLGVDAVSLANNHTMDFGPGVLTQTMNHLESAGIDYFGAGRNLDEASAPFRYKVPTRTGERNLYTLGALKNTSTLRDTYGFFATKDAAGVNALSPNPICDQIRHLREMDPQAFIVLFPHWGQNYSWASDLMRRRSRQYISAGANVVIGHGAHMLQEVERYGAGSTVFSIGNFVFNSGGRYSRLGGPPYSLIARLALSTDGDELIGDLKLYPIVCDNKLTNYRSRPVTKNEAAEVTEHLARHSGVEFGRNYELNSDERGWYIRQKVSIGYSA